jgi:hypothetical protein
MMVIGFPGQTACFSGLALLLTRIFLRHPVCICSRRAGNIIQAKTTPNGKRIRPFTPFQSVISFKG